MSFGGYSCPDCGVEPPSESFYYFDGSENVDCTAFDDESMRLKANPPFGKKSYPVYSNQTTNVWAAIEFGGNPMSWTETHFCPNCQKEFTISNSNY